MPRAPFSILALLGLFCARLIAQPLPVVQRLSDGADLTLPPLNEDVAKPQETLGYPLGERFTHHDRIVAYMRALDASSDRVALHQYGSTYEGRPLLVAAISSSENISRIEEVRTRHLKLADPRDTTDTEIANIVANDPVVVWLGYGVHGNESSSAEAALLTAYTLAAAEGPWVELLEDLVVLIDPLENPDGRERYVHFFETQRGRVPNASPVASEHWEPWPGGRQNHYLVDLNRDWAWASQIETQARIEHYRKWEPQVFVDLHEMSADSTYFFPPAADPISPLIPSSSIGWLDAFGRANAEAFDRQGWTYYVGQRFDLFYPGYGDSYPGLRGAIGMTYEMAGHGRAGSAYRRSDGRVLTLADRLARHFTSSMATVRTAVENREALLRDFAASRTAAIDAAPRSYLWEARHHEARTAADLLATHGVSVETLTESRRLAAQPLSGEAATDHVFPAGSYVVHTRQPLGSLVRALMERDVPMADDFIERQRRRVERNQSPQFYDITAWSLPLALNLEAYSVDQAISGAPLTDDPTGSLQGQGDLGFLIAPQGIAGYRAAAQLWRQGIRYRLATEGLELDGRKYPAGTLFVPRRNNPETTLETLSDIAREIVVERVGSGLSSTGISLGSDEVVPIRLPSIGVLSGEGVSVTSFGYLWHLLDRQVGVPHHRIDIRTLRQIDLAKLDVLVMPHGFGYRRQIGDETVERLGGWIERGGVLIAVGGAVTWANDNDLVEVESWAPPEEDPEPNEVVELSPANRSLYTPGAALATRLQSNHPLASGLASAPAAIFQGSTILLPSGNPRQDVLVADPDEAVIAGFAWPEASERLKGALLVGARRSGRGGIVLFAQEPAYRLFWRSTTPIFLNSVMYGPSLAERRRLVQ